MNVQLMVVGVVCASLGTITSLAVEPRKIEVRATGEVTVPADELRLPLELNTSGNDFEDVKQRNDELLEQVLDVVDAHKLARPAVESTMATFDFSPSEPRRSFPSAKGNQQANRGKNDDPFGEPDTSGPPLHMSRRLILRFGRLAEATEVIAELTALDVVRESREVRLSSLQAGLKDPVSHQRKARRLAVQRAREQAAELAEASGLQLGAPLNVDELGISDAGSGRFGPMDDPFGPSVPRFRPIGPPQDDDGPRNAQSAAQITVSLSVRVVYEGH